MAVTKYQTRQNWAEKVYCELAAYSQVELVVVVSDVGFPTFVRGFHTPVRQSLDSCRTDPFSIESNFLSELAILKINHMYVFVLQCGPSMMLFFDTFSIFYQWCVQLNGALVK